MERDPLEYVMNRMEAAAHSDDPAGNGYGPARKELLEGIAALREIEKRAGNVDGMAKVLYEINPIPTGEKACGIDEMWTWEGLPEEVRENYLSDARSVSRWLKERK